MSPEIQPKTDTPPDSTGEVRPPTDKNSKLEDRIAEEKDDELASEGAPSSK
jgi:hypothetical protein